MLQHGVTWQLWHGRRGVQVLQATAARRPIELPREGEVVRALLRSRHAVPPVARELRVITAQRPMHGVQHAACSTQRGQAVLCDTRHATWRGCVAHRAA